MNWKAHFIGGIIFCTLTILLLMYSSVTMWGVNWWNLATTIPIIFLYSLLPDLDHEGSKITHFLLYVGVLFNALVVYGFWTGETPFKLIIFSAILLFAMIQFIRLPHRGFSHTLTCALLLTVPVLYFFGLTFASIAFVSYWSHLWLDIKRKNPFYPLRIWGALR